MVLQLNAENYNHDEMSLPAKDHEDGAHGWVITRGISPFKEKFQVPFLYFEHQCSIIQSPQPNKHGMFL